MLGPTLPISPVTTPIDYLRYLMVSRHRKQLSKSTNVLRVFTPGTWMWTAISLISLATTIQLALLVYKSCQQSLVMRPDVRFPDILLCCIAAVTEPEQLPWFHKSAATGQAEDLEF